MTDGLLSNEARDWNGKKGGSALASMGAAEFYRMEQLYVKMLFSHS